MRDPSAYFSLDVDQHMQHIEIEYGSWATNNSKEEYQSYTDNLTVDQI